MEIIEGSIKELKITTLDISFNELADMYDNNELIISPDYQRTFRWSQLKQSRLIESMLLEMPIPAIYAIEIDDGRYELIDGLQRISSYLNFRGLLKNPNIGIAQIESSEVDETDLNQGDDDDLEEVINIEEIFKSGFSLNGCDIIRELNDKTFDELPSILKIRLKRSFVRMEVLRKGINPELKYHMFKRLNTGGEVLSPQELRNCTIRIIGNKFINFINRLSLNEDFLATIKYVSDIKKQKKYSEELVLRFFAFKNCNSDFIHDVGAFMTEYMEKIALSDAKGDNLFDYEKEEIIFVNSFKLLNETMNKEAFATIKRNSSNLTGFNVYQYEAITAGMQVIGDFSKKITIDNERLKELVKEIKDEPEFKNATIGGGKNSSGVFLIRYNIVKEKLRELNTNE